MTRVLLAIAGATFFMAAEAQEIDAPYESDYAKPRSEARLWHEMRDSFIRHAFSKILQKHGLRLNCGDCSSVFMDVSFSVDEQGKVRVKGIDRKKACGGDFSSAMEADFIAFLHTYPYPQPLRGSRVRLRLGNGLKC